jgi:hypothetical protein
MWVVAVVAASRRPRRWARVGGGCSAVQWKTAQRRFTTLSHGKSFSTRPGHLQDSLLTSRKEFHVLLLRVPEAEAGNLSRVESVPRWAGMASVDLF